MSAASAAESTTARDAQPGLSWRVQLVVTGGFAGFDQVFTTTADSESVLAADRRRDYEVEVALPIPERQDIARQVSALTSLPGRDQRSSQCRDCYRFELTIDSDADGRARRSVYDSTTLPGSPDEQLIGLLITIGRAGLNLSERN